MLYSRSNSMPFSFFNFFSVSHHILGHTVIVSHFPRFSVFSPKYRSHSVYFLYFTFFTVSRHIPVPTMSNSHFASISVFLAKFHFLPCEFLIFLVCQFSCHIPDPTMWVSHFRFLSVFSLCSSSYNVHFSFSMFFRFLATIQVLQFVVLIIHVFQCFPPYSRSYMCVSHFPSFSVFSP